MRIFIRLFYIFILIIVTECHAYGRTVSLQDALYQTIEYNKRIQAEKSKFDAAKYRFEQATRRIFPSVSANTSYGVQNSKIGNAPYEDYPEKRYGITLNQDIYTFGRISAASEKARYDMLTSYINIDIIKTEESLKLIKTYIGLYSNLKIQNFLKDQIAILKKRINVTEKQTLSGEANDIDVIQLQAELITQNAYLQKILSEQISLQETYKSLTGDNIVPNFLNPASVCMLDNNKKAIIQSIHQHNFNIRQAQETIKSADQDVELSKSNFYPTVSFVANAERYEGNSAFFRDKTQTSSAVVQVNIPIFDRGTEYSKLKEAKANKLSREYDFMDTKNQILNMFESDYNLYQSQKYLITSHKKSIQALKLLLKKTQHEQKLGLKSINDILDIQHKKIQTQIDLMNLNTEHLFYRCKIIGLQGGLPIVTTQFHIKD